MENKKLYQLGDEVTFTKDGKTLTGYIVNIYAVPKDFDIIDVMVDGVIYYGIKTDEVQGGIQE